MFRALAFCPIDELEAFFNALITSEWYKKPYSLDPKQYKKLRGGKFETEAIYRKKLNEFAEYMIVRI